MVWGATCDRCGYEFVARNFLEGQYIHTVISTPAWTRSQQRVKRRMIELIIANGLGEIATEVVDGWAAQRHFERALADDIADGHRESDEA